MSSDPEAQLIILVEFQIGSKLSWVFRGRKKQWEGWELGVGRDFTEHLPQLNRAGEVGMQGCPAPLTSWVMTSRCDRQHNCNHNLTGGVVLSFFPTYTLLGIDQEARKGGTNRGLSRCYQWFNLTERQTVWWQHYCLKQTLGSRCHDVRCSANILFYKVLKTKSYDWF